MKRFLITICVTIPGILHCLSNSAFPIAFSRQDAATIPNGYSSTNSDTADTLSIVQSLEEAENVCYVTGREYACIQYSKRLCEVLRQYYGPFSEKYLLELLNLSELYSQRLRHSKSYEIHDMAYAPYMQKLRDDFGALAIEDRQNYWMDASKYIRKTLDIAYKTASRFRIDDASLMAGSAYNATLLYKGILLNLTRDADVRNIPQLRIVWQDIQNALTPDDLAIEFFRTDDGGYGAILLKKKWRGPKLIRLPVPKRKSADEVLLSASREMSTAGQCSEDILFQASGIVWSDRLLQYFPKGGDGNIYFSCDGILLQTVIEYLPFAKANGKTGYYTMSDAYNLVRLSSTRELVTGKPHMQLDSAAIFGGIYYNVSRDSSVSPSGKVRGAINELPATLDEVLSIEKSLASKGVAVRLKTGSYADEQSYLELDGTNYNIIHIATHGYYWTKEQSPEIENPLERCGLLFAGALASSSSANPHMKGLLSAKEISTVNLPENDLVVLSACKTAMGDTSSDGVFGLQRGFKMAGAGSVIMSLWEVHDEVTKELMTYFYSNLLIPGQTKRTAFKSAIETVRVQHPEPYYWAAFILLDGID